MLQELIAANTGKSVIAFTHKPVLGDDASPVQGENSGLGVAAILVGRAAGPA